MVKFLTSTLYLSSEGNFISSFVGCPRIFSYPQIGYWAWPFLTQFVYMRLDIGPRLFQRSLNTWYNWSPQSSYTIVLSLLKNRKVLSQLLFITSISWKNKILRLCLVAVNRFLENTYFPEMLISGKWKYFHVFGCVSKNFPENIFWCLEKKKENTNQKTQATTQKKKKSSTTKMFPVRRLRDRRRDREARSRSTARSRSRLLREITIDGTISPSRDRAVDRDLGLDLELTIPDWIFSSRTRARSLSLSLSHFPKML